MPRPILVVEDDSDIRLCLYELLEAEGHPVTLATDGHDALGQLASSERPCLILLDLMMPRMDGLELLAHLQADAQLRTIPVVVCSAGRQELPPGARDILKKPFRVEELLQHVARYCEE